jgi:hypothetical protein
MHLGCWDVAQLLESVKESPPVALSKISQHPACIDDAILNGKPFGIPLFQFNSPEYHSLSLSPPELILNQGMETLV